jgi:hypothetical protein
LIAKKTAGFTPRDLKSLVSQSVMAATDRVRRSLHATYVEETNADQSIDILASSSVRLTKI